MGSDQSTLSEKGFSSLRRPKQDKYSTSRPIGEGMPSSKSQPSFSQFRQTAPTMFTRSGDHGSPSSASAAATPPKHDIVVVADGSVAVKDPDPELTRLNTIPSFSPIIRSSLNLVSGTRGEQELEETLDYHSLLVMALRYQEHLKQLAEAVAFDQNSLCVRIKEVAHMIHMLNSKLQEQQKRYTKSVEQFERVTEMVTTLDKVKKAVKDIVPTMNRLNQQLPEAHQLEPCELSVSLPGMHSIQAS